MLCYDNIRNLTFNQTRKEIEMITGVIKIFALVVAAFFIGLAACPKEIPRIGLVIWAKNAHWQSRVFLALSGIFLVLVVLWYW